MSELGCCGGYGGVHAEYCRFFKKAMNHSDQRPSIREEFEKAYNTAPTLGSRINYARYMAKWAMEKIAALVDSPEFYVGPRESRSRKILELAKELSQ